MARDPYAILGVAKTASEADIKSAYRKLAKKYHPDLNPDKKEAAQRFQEVGAAYALLSDAEKRAAFDRGEIDMEGQPTRQQFYRDHAQEPGAERYHHFHGGNFQGGGDAEGADFSDLFSSFFQRGGAGGFGTQPPSGDVRYRIDIDFIEAAKGAQKRVTMPDGRTLDITIPEGVEEGQQLRLKGQGRKQASGTGDAYIEIHFRPHPAFTREGHTVRSEVAVGFDESILAAKVPVETVHGTVEVTIPKGAGSGTSLRLKGKGIRGGDHFVKLRIVMPPVIDGDLESAIRQWKSTHAYDPRKRKEKTA